MKTILRILKQAGGWHHGLYLKIENLPYMALVIEATDESGPCGLPSISVAHYGEQNGDLMHDLARRRPGRSRRATGGRPVKCPYCEGMRYEILRVPDMRYRYGFRQLARRCDHKIEEGSDGKAAAAGGE